MATSFSIFQATWTFWPSCLNVTWNCTIRSGKSTNGTDSPAPLSWPIKIIIMYQKTLNLEYNKFNFKFYDLRLIETNSVYHHWLNGGRTGLWGLCFRAMITIYPWWLPLKVSSFHMLYSEMWLSLNPTTYNHAFLILKGNRGAMEMDKMRKCFAWKHENLIQSSRKKLVIAAHAYNPSIGDETERSFRLEGQSV